MPDPVTPSGPHQGQPLHTAGHPLDQAKGAMILVHGRGATAPSILLLAEALNHPQFAYLAPQAAGNSWYPYSFLAPLADNEPGLSSGLAVLSNLVTELEAAGLPPERLILAGFSQGACLVLEFVARNARRYGGVAALSGGLIGPLDSPRNYTGSLAGAPIFIGCSDVDMHIPLARVHESTAVLSEMGAEVTEHIYPGLGHTINQDEIEQVRRLMSRLSGER